LGAAAGGLSAPLDVGGFGAPYGGNNGAINLWTSSSEV